MTYAEFFSEFKKRIIGTDVSDIHEHLAFQFCIEDDEAGGIFYAEVKEGTLYVEPYEFYDKDANFICSTDTLIKIADGELDPVKAYTSGSLKVEGNINKALKLKDIIDHRKAQEKKAKAAAKKAAAKSSKKTTKATETKKTSTAKSTTTKASAKKTIIKK